jgi:hypothetical protein
MRLQHVLMGSAAFAASVYSGYMYAQPMKSLPQAAPAAADDTSGHSAFDRLAGVYDNIIGSEERWMFYGLLRWWLLREAQVCSAAVRPAARAMHGMQLVLSALMQSAMPALLLCCVCALAYPLFAHLSVVTF